MHFNSLNERLLAGSCTPHRPTNLGDVSPPAQQEVSTVWRPPWSPSPPNLISGQTPRARDINDRIYVRLPPN